MARKLSTWQRLVKKYGGVKQALPHYKKSGKGKARRARSHGRRRSRRSNPSGLGAISGAAPVKMLTSKNVWLDVAMIGAGVYANYQARQFLTKNIMAGTPSSDPKSYLLGVGAAVAAGFIPKVGPKLMIGGLLMETVRALNQYVIPQQYKVQIGDYLDTQERIGYLDTSTPIGYLDTSTPIGDYLNTSEKIGEYDGNLSGDDDLSGAEDFE
jgi:hypothetical protein